MPLLAMSPRAEFPINVIIVKIVNPREILEKKTFIKENIVHNYIDTATVHAFRNCLCCFPVSK